MIHEYTIIIWTYVFLQKSVYSFFSAVCCFALLLLIMIVVYIPVLFLLYVLLCCMIALVMSLYFKLAHQYTHNCICYRHFLLQYVCMNKNSHKEACYRFYYFIFYVSWWHATTWQLLRLLLLATLVYWLEFYFICFLYKFFKVLKTQFLLSLYDLHAGYIHTFIWVFVGNYCNYFIVPKSKFYHK